MDDLEWVKEQQAENQTLRNDLAKALAGLEQANARIKELEGQVAENQTLRNGLAKALANLEQANARIKELEGQAAKDSHNSSKPPGFVPLLVGVGLYIWCAGAFTFIGKGTPAPFDAPKFLVKEGPYQWVRNPIYIAILLVVIGEAILFRSFLLVGYALLVGAVVYLFVVFVEEPSLHRQFGESYEAYLRTVPRWLPRCHRRDGLLS